MEASSDRAASPEAPIISILNAPKEMMRSRSVLISVD